MFETSCSLYPFNSKMNIYVFIVFYFDLYGFVNEFYVNVFFQ